MVRNPQLSHSPDSNAQTHIETSETVNQQLGAMAARRAHNPEVEGSILSVANRISTNVYFESNLEVVSLLQFCPNFFSLFFCLLQTDANSGGAHVTLF